MYGFIREQYNDLVPDGVILICLLFYGNDTDKWDINNISDYIQLDEEQAIVTHIKRQQPTSVFLTREVHSVIHSWKFKVIKCRNHKWCTMHIGIWNVSKNDGKPPKLNTFNYVKDERQGYSFSTSAGKIRSSSTEYVKWGEKCPDGSIVDMTVNFNELSLCFKLNGKNCGKAYDIEPGKYRAAVYLCFTKDSFQFIEKY